MDCKCRFCNYCQRKAEREAAEARVKAKHQTIAHKPIELNWLVYSGSLSLNAIIIATFEFQSHAEAFVMWMNCDYGVASKSLFYNCDEKTD